MSTVPQLRITLAGSEFVVAAGTTAGEAIEVGGTAGSAVAAQVPAAGGTAVASPATVIAAKVNGQPRDLAWPLTDGDTVEPIAIGSEDGRAIMRHSAAHVMAQAVQELFPEAKLGIGPPIENGFYYDFDVNRPFTPDDLAAIERRMRQIIKQGQLFSRRVASDEDARKELADEPYKLELIGLKGGASTNSADTAGSAGSTPDEASVEVDSAADGELTIYDNLDAATRDLRWKDLCRGPHLPTTRQIPALKVMRMRVASQSGIAGHLKLGNQATVGAKSGVMRDVPDGGTVLGIPAAPEKQAKRQMIAVTQLPELIRRVRKLEKQVEQLNARSA